MITFSERNERRRSTRCACAEALSAGRLEAEQLDWLRSLWLIDWLMSDLVDKSQTRLLVCNDNKDYETDCRIHISRITKNENTRGPIARRRRILGVLGALSGCFLAALRPSPLLHLESVSCKKLWEARWWVYCSADDFRDQLGSGRLRDLSFFRDTLRLPWSISKKTWG